jgi:exonuclease III
MKLVCLNIWNGGGSRWAKIIEFVEAQKPDVIVLPEWRAGPPEKEGWANSLKMCWDSISDGKTSNGVFVAARQTFNQGKILNR